MSHPDIVYHIIRRKQKQTCAFVDLGCADSISIAAVHSVMVQRLDGYLKKWNRFLYASPNM
jgi:hypothetical protein